MNIARWDRPTEHAVGSLELRLPLAKHRGVKMKLMNVPIDNFMLETHWTGLRKHERLMIDKGVRKVEWGCGAGTESTDGNAALVQFFVWVALPESVANELIETGKLCAAASARFTQGQWNASFTVLSAVRKTAQWCGQGVFTDCECG